MPRILLDPESRYVPLRKLVPHGPDADIEEQFCRREESRARIEAHRQKLRLKDPEAPVAETPKPRVRRYGKLPPGRFSLVLSMYPEDVDALGAIGAGGDPGEGLHALALVWDQDPARCLAKLKYNQQHREAVNRRKYRRGGPKAQHLVANGHEERAMCGAGAGDRNAGLRVLIDVWCDIYIKGRK